MYKFTHNNINFEIDVDGYVPDPEGNGAILAKTFYGFSDDLIAKVKQDKLRNDRSALLSQTDWWASSDRVMSQEQIDYRQALRDITENYSDVSNVQWPVKPT